MRDGWQTQRSAGGLATAMRPVLDRTGGLWIGSTGDSGGSDPARAAVVRGWAERNRYYAVDLPPDVSRLYYEGFANQTLWPLFHHFPMLLQFQPEAWNAYREANRRFCDEVVRHYRPGDTIWIHDYHLMLLPQMLREAIPDAAIGWFLHIPFPSSEVFRVLPRRDEILQGLLGADLLAFQTHSHLQHFRTSLLRIAAGIAFLQMKRWGHQWLIITCWFGIVIWIGYTFNMTMYADIRYAGVVFPVVGWWLYDIFYITPFLAIPYLHTVNREIFSD